MEIVKNFLKYDALLKANFKEKLFKLYQVECKKVIFDFGKLFQVESELSTFDFYDDKHILEYNISKQNFEVVWWCDGKRYSYLIPNEFFDDFDNFIKKYEKEIYVKSKIQVNLFKNYLGENN